MKMEIRREIFRLCLRFACDPVSALAAHLRMFVHLPQRQSIPSAHRLPLFLVF